VGIAPLAGRNGDVFASVPEIDETSSIGQYFSRPAFAADSDSTVA
jgi:hypothetical protein